MIQPVIHKMECGCRYDESGALLHRCAGHQVGSIRLAPPPRLQRARRLTPTHPAAGAQPILSVKAKPSRDWESLAYRWTFVIALSLFWLWVGMRCDG